MCQRRANQVTFIDRHHSIAGSNLMNAPLFRWLHRLHTQSLTHSLPLPRPPLHQTTNQPTNNPVLGDLDPFGALAKLSTRELSLAIYRSRRYSRFTKRLRQSALCYASGIEKGTPGSQFINS